jgi:hypothetical protein
MQMHCCLVGKKDDRYFKVSVRNLAVDKAWCVLTLAQRGERQEIWCEKVRDGTLTLQAPYPAERTFLPGDWNLVMYEFVKEDNRRETLVIIPTDFTEQMRMRCKFVLNENRTKAVDGGTRKVHSQMAIRVLLKLARRIRSFEETVEDYLPCRWLYRHKPLEYFVDIMANHGNVMKVYVKDNNGDPASCINRLLNGLFFSANVNFWNGAPLWQPMFGQHRLLISCQKMFEFAPNLYFADVYCNTSKYHHVTLVMARPGTDADRFCREKLVRLNVYDRKMNPFLFFDGQQAYVSTRVMVEVLYTADVDIGSCLRDNEFDASLNWCPIPYVKDRHRGRPKNPFCTLCNLPANRKL